MSALFPLLDEVRACRVCEGVLPLGPRPVLQLHPRARILIAAQAPGRKVHATGIPFSDASGERLRRWLGLDATAFHDPHRVAILPMGFCYPGTGPSGDLPPRPECAAQWHARLLHELRDLQLKLVIGRYALAHHLPGNSASLAELARQQPAGHPVTVVLPHPSPRNNRWLKQHPWFEAEQVPRLQTLVQRALQGASA